MPRPLYPRCNSRRYPLNKTIRGPALNLIFFPVSLKTQELMQSFYDRRSVLRLVSQAVVRPILVEGFKIQWSWGILRNGRTGLSVVSLRQLYNLTLLYVQICILTQCLNTSNNMHGLRRPWLCTVNHVEDER